MSACPISESTIVDVNLIFDIRRDKRNGASAALVNCFVRERYAHENDYTRLGSRKRVHINYTTK